jgi:O-antigen ligase
MARRADRFAEVERADPTMAFVHLVAACAWMATLSIGRAPEGIAFGILMAVAAVRAPKTARLYPQLVGCSALVLLVAFAEWQGLSSLWSSAPRLGARDYLPRYVFIPLALWPVMHRWPTAIAAFAIPAAVHGAAIAIAGFARHGWNPGVHNGLATNEIGMTGHAFAIAVAVLAGAAGPRSIAGWMTRIASIAAIATGVLSMGQRTPILAATAGAGTSLAMRWRGALRTTRGRIRVAVAVACIALLGVGFLGASHRNRAWIRGLARLTDPTTGSPTDSALWDATSARLPLYRVALDIWGDHPVIGAGARGFAIGNAERAESRPGDFGVPQAAAPDFAKLTCAHNGFLDEAAERGIVGVALLAALVGSCWLGALRLDAWPGTAGMIAAWSVASITQPVTVRGVPMMILAIIVTRVCAVERET